MNSLPSNPGLGAHAVMISRVADDQWHATENDLVVGRGHASRRLDGRTFLSIDTWRGAVFDQLAGVMLAAQSTPVYTVIDENDHELAASWERAGFTIWRREREFEVLTDPQLAGRQGGQREEPSTDDLPGAGIASSDRPEKVLASGDPSGTGLASSDRPEKVLASGDRSDEVVASGDRVGTASSGGVAGVVFVAGDGVAEGPLRVLDEAVRGEVEGAVGWATMPAEVLAWRGGARPLEPAKYTVAVRDGRYVGLVRIAARTRRPRIGLVAVLGSERRRGIGRALLGQVLERLHASGVEAVTAEVDETNAAGLALFEGLGARRTGSSLELVFRPGQV